MKIEHYESNNNLWKGKSNGNVFINKRRRKLIIWNIHNLPQPFNVETYYILYWEIMIQALQVDKQKKMKQKDTEQDDNGFVVVLFLKQNENKAHLLCIR